MQIMVSSFAKLALLCQFMS